MSSGAGNILDMINRMHQNRNMLASKRTKFKENNRAIKYSNTDKVKFKTVSNYELIKIKHSIKNNANIEHKKEVTVSIIITIIVFISFIYVLL